MPELSPVPSEAMAQAGTIDRGWVKVSKRVRP
ncbi:unnamed protein product, partial [marine sediment metagenome]